MRLCEMKDYGIKNLLSNGAGASSMMRSRKILSILIVTVALLGQGQITYGEGVNISFQNSLISAVNNSPSSPEATSAQVTSLINAFREALTAASSGAPAADTSAGTMLTSPSWKYTFVAPSSAEFFDTQERVTKELIQPITFGSLPENESLLPDAESFGTTVCLSDSPIVPPACSDLTPLEEAAHKLAATFLNAQAKKARSRPFRIVMPATMPMERQKAWVNQIESQAITLIESQAFQDGTPLKEFDAVARREAPVKANWSHALKDNMSIYHLIRGKNLSN